MGSLSNLYISQSYQSLIHLATNNTASATLIGLEDGLGNPIGVSVNTAGNLYLSGTFSASLQEGYIYVGNSSSRTIAFPTSSFITELETGSLLTTASFNAYTASTNIRLSNIELTTASVLVSINNINTFTSSANISINALNVFTASQSTASLVTSITNLNQFTQSQESFNSSATASIVALQNFSSSLDANFVTEAELAAATGSLITQINTKLNTSSFNSYTSSNNQRVDSLESNSASVNTSITNINSFTQSANIRLNNLETTSASVNVSIANINSTTASQATSISNLNTSASLALTTASLSGQTLTFTKGDNSTFGIILPDVSGSDITALNQFTASQLNINTGYNTFTSSANQRLSSLETTSASLNISVSALNTFTASQSTASIVTSINNLNTFSASALVSINELNQNSASVNTSISNINQFTQSAQISINSINAATSSYITESETASFARTNVDNNFTANQTFTNITAVSASFTYVQTLFETSSVIYSSGSNQFGDELTDIQTLSGSVKIRGGLLINDLDVTQSISSINSFTQSAAISISNLNQFTASQSTASIVTSITNLNQFTQSADIRLTNIENTTASLNTSVTNINTFSASALVSINNLNSATASYVTETESGSFLITASFDNGTRNLTFTKGDTTTFAVNIPDVSGSAGNFVTTSSFNAYTSSNDQRVTSLEANSASVNISISALNTFTASQSTASLVTSIDNLNQSSASQQVSINNINTATASLFISAGLALVTASISNDDITFTKGDGSTFTIQVATGSFALSASYADSASYAQFAQDIYLNVKNTTGAQLNKGTVVRIIGATGDNALIATASWEDDNNSANTLGFLYENIANDAFGKVITQGTLLGIDTDPVLGYAAGDLVYLSGSGQYTKVKPPAPYHEVRLGQVLRAQQNNGSVYVLIQNGYELSELHDVDINTGSLANNNLLAYNSASEQWENKTLTQVGGVLTSSFNQYTQSTDNRLTNIESTTASLNTSITNINNFTSSANGRLNSLEAATASYVTEGESGSFLITGSVAGNVLTFTKGDNTTFNLTVATGSGGGGTTYINPTLNPYSGSLILVANTFTSSSFAHISASANGQVNLVFKNNNNTPDTIISGSNNIFTNPAAPTTGFKRYVGGSGNIALNASNVPEISGSMAFSPTMNNNYFGGNSTTLAMRGPVSSSTYTISGNSILGTVNFGSSAANHAQGLASGVSMTGNQIAGTLTVIANKSNLSSSLTFSNNNLNGGLTLNLNSSSVSMGNNNINDSALVVNNNFFTGSAGIGSVILNVNNIGGASNTITIQGTLPVGTTNTPFINANTILGGINTLFVDPTNTTVSGTSAYHSAIRNIIGGSQLIVSASSLSSDNNSLGSAYFGRYNANDGIRNKTSNIVFAVGTGNTTTRKTGFLIDSGSNTFVEGTLNVSGSSTFTGSVNITGSLLLNGASVSINTSSFATTGSNQFNGNQTITGSLTMTGSILFIDRSGNDSNIYLGTNALGMGPGFGAPLALGNTQAIAIGQGAMRFASGSSQNIAIGNNTLAINSGSKNFAMGGEAMTNNTTGDSNVAIGVNALNLNVSSNDNVAIGSNALQNAMSAQNTGIGADTIKNAKSNSASNVALGKGALQNHYDGDSNSGQNMAIGFDAMGSMTSGSANVAIGPGTFRDPSRANENVFIGWTSGINASGSVDQNVVIGARAANKLANSSNTIIGHSAASELRNGARNIFIGQGIGGNIITGSNNTLIGNIGGVDNWQSVIALSNGDTTNSIKFFNSGSNTTLTNDTLISGSLTTTGSATIGKVLELTQLNPLPTGADGQLAVSASNLYFFSGSAWNRVSLV